MSRLVTEQKPNFQLSECQTCWLQICHTSGLLIQLLATPGQHTRTRTHTHTERETQPYLVVITGALCTLPEAGPITCGMLPGGTLTYAPVTTPCPH